MKVFITGAYGEVGTRTVHKFLDEGHSVVAFGHRDEPKDPSKLRSNLTYVKGEAADFDQVLKAMERCDAVCSIAAAPGPGDYKTKTYNGNVITSFNVLRAAAEHGIRRIAQASSINAVGAKFNEKVYIDYLPIDEKHPRRPDEGYGLSKICMEEQADAICRRFPKTRIASLRPHWCIANDVPLPPQILPDSPTEFANESFEDVTKMEDDEAHKQLWGWNSYTSIADAFYLAITTEGRGWEQGHEIFFIVSPRLGSNSSARQLVQRWFPNAELRGSLSTESVVTAKLEVSKSEKSRGPKAMVQHMLQPSSGEKREFSGGETGLYDCSKARKLLGWVHD